MLRNLSIRDREKGLSAGEKRMIHEGAPDPDLRAAPHTAGKSEEDAELMIDEVLDDAHGVKMRRRGLSPAAPHPPEARLPRSGSGSCAAPRR